MPTKKINKKKETLNETISDLIKWNMEMQKEYLEKINILIDKIMAKDYQQYKAFETQPVVSSEPNMQQMNLDAFEDDWTEEVKG